MEKSNIIISIIIVLCIAAAVTAYGLTNNDDAIFSDLANMGSSDLGDNGIGDSSGSSSNGASSSGGSGSGSGRGGSGGGGSGGGGDSGSITQSVAKQIAQKHISQAGCTAGTPYLRGNEWKVPVYDSHGNQVDTISVNRYTGAVGRG